MPPGRDRRVVIDRLRSLRQRHRRVDAGLRFLRAHWLETVAAVSLAALLIAVDPIKLAGILRRSQPIDILLMLPTVVFVYALRGAGWWVALRHLGVRISLFRATYIMFAGQTLIFMPTGDLARVAMVERTGASGVDQGAIAGSIAFQELLFMGLLGLGVLPRLASHPDIALLVLVMTLAHVGIFVILLWKPAYDGAVSLVERVRLLRRFDPQLRSLRPAFTRMMAPRNLGGVIGCNALAAAAMFVLFYLALRAVGVQHIAFGEATFVYGLAHLLSGLSLLPGGVGSMEAIVTVLLARRGVPTYQGAAAAILFRGFNDVVMAAVGAVAGLEVRRESEHRGERADRGRPTSQLLDVPEDDAGRER